VRGLAAEADGSFFAVVNVGVANPKNELWHISHAGFSYRVGNTGYPGLQGLTSVGGTLYGFDLPAFGVGVGLVRIDRVTGVATDVNPVIGSPVFDIQFLATRAAGKVFGGRDALYEIDVTTGAYTLIGGAPSGPSATLTFQVGLLDAGAAQGLAMTKGVWIRTQ
jgi:hypothetical protein